MLHPSFQKLDLDVPLMSLSEQILSKFAKSSDGRALSIGTQYLRRKLYEVAIVAPKRTNQIACNLFVNCLSCDLRRTKSSTIFNSVSSAASNPRESWKT